MICDLKYIQKFKGEFEAEGLSRAELASEVVFAAKHGFDYLVKISGCEALSDIYYLEKLGVGSIVCPMIESPFAMRKYMSSVANKGFNSIGVTIETITAVNNVEEILDAGEHLTEVTVGRSDLSASAGIKEVEDDLVTDMVVHVAKSAKARGLTFTMGGSISSDTTKTLKRRSDLLGLLDSIETRKTVIHQSHLLNSAALNESLLLEKMLLEKRLSLVSRVSDSIKKRIVDISSRMIV